MSFVGALPAIHAGTRPALAAFAAARIEGVTQLADLAQHAPLRLLFPRVPVDEPLTACVINTAGGIVGGDQHTVRVHALQGARVMAIAQSAEKVYRSSGATAFMDVQLTAEAGAWLEYLPQETIIFDEARFERRTRLDLAADARALAGEMLVFGRAAHGEVVRNGLVRDVVEVAIDGRLAWTDTLHLEGDLRAPLTHPAAFAGDHVAALMLLHAPGAEAHRDALRELPAFDGGRFGATVVGGLVIARWLGRDGMALRRHYASAWTLLRSRAAGLAPRLPPLWHI